MPGKSEDKAPLLLSFSCSNKWESMEGDGNVRSCESCACKVQNISDYSQTQIDELLARVDAGEKICVAFRRPNNPAVASVVPVSQQIDLGSADWFSNSNYYLSALGASKEALLSPGVTRFSIALAASISLTYFIPSEHQVASAQDAHNFSNRFPSSGSPAQSVKQDPSNQIPSKPAADPSANKMYQETRASRMAEFRRRAGESGFTAGAVAPNGVRLLVGEIGTFKLDLTDVFIFPLLQSFNEEVDRGNLSLDKLENLAKGYDVCCQSDRARRCYSLLLQVADKQNADPKRVQEWRKQVDHLAPKEFDGLIKKYDASCSKQDYDKALECLVEANSVRKLTPALAQSLSWREISTRMDSLQSKPSGLSKANLLQQEFDFFRDEKTNPELQRWIRSKDDYAVLIFGEEIAASDKLVAEKKYDDAFGKLSNAHSIGNLDKEVTKQCDWNTLEKKIRRLLPNLWFSRNLGPTLLSEVEKMNKPPAASSDKQQK